MTDIAMPQLSDSMEQGLVLQWLIEDGATVAVGEELVEIETDKATMTYESEVEGTLSIVVPEGSTVAVGEVIARVGAAVASGAAASVDTAAPARAAVPEEVAAAPVNGKSSNGHIAGGGDGDGDGGHGHGHEEAAPATPVARRLAAVHGISLAALEGSGPRGRITKADVLSASGVEAPVAAPRPRPAPATSAPVASAPVASR